MLPKLQALKDEKIWPVSIKLPKELLFNFAEIMQKNEPLSPELMPYLSDKGAFMAIQHPLLYDVPFLGLAALSNARFAINKYRAEQFLEAQDYLGYINIHEKPYRISALLEVYENLEEGVCIEAFLENFISSENVSQAKDDWIGLVEYMGVEAIQQHLDDNEMLEPVDLSSPGKIEIFRGICLKDSEELSTFSEHIGLSWTTDYEVAVRFANRFKTEGTTPVIFTAEAPFDCVIGPFNTRGEMEVIILPEYISDLIEVEYLDDISAKINR